MRCVTAAHRNAPRSYPDEGEQQPPTRTQRAGRGTGGPSATGGPDARPLDHRPPLGSGPQHPPGRPPAGIPPRQRALVAYRHRYAYTAGTAEMWRAYETVDGVPPDERFSNYLIKHDMLRGSRHLHRCAKGVAADEPVFVPRRGARDEDDGHVLSYVNDPTRGGTDLVILSVQDFGGHPLARVRLPGRVPLGFHGSWIPDA
ncbi:carotenoid oxygenase family protein [Streptomyces nodosus]|uniref:carotenoid oxygenase family protein n=1 Tax=Streptomyces nodosus TaxID=40318 RepID=UPI00382ADC91